MALFRNHLTLEVWNHNTTLHQMEIHWFTYIQLLSLIVAIYCFKGLKKLSLVSFIPLLVIVCTTEIIAANFRQLGWESNYFVFNVYLLLSTPLKLMLFSQMLQMNRMIKYLFAFICVVVLTAITLNTVFWQGFREFNTYSLLIICLADIVFSAFIIYQLVFNDQAEMLLLKHTLFWINAPILFFSLITLVVLGLQPYIRENNLLINKITLYYFIMPIINVILYGSWTYAFILCQKQVR